VIAAKSVNLVFTLLGEAGAEIPWRNHIEYSKCWKRGLSAVAILRKSKVSSVGRKLHQRSCVSLYLELHCFCLIFVELTGSVIKCAKFNAEILA